MKEYLEAVALLTQLRIFTNTGQMKQGSFTRINKEAITLNTGSTTGVVDIFVRISAIDIAETII